MLRAGSGDPRPTAGSGDPRPTARSEAPRPSTVCAVLAVLFFVATALSAAERNASFTAAVRSITSKELSAHVHFLADDSLEGREPGTKGGRAAGDYLATQLAELRLKPAGVDGGHFQPFDRGFRNVLAIVEGSDERLKTEVIVLGTHYDHVGYGTVKNSRGPVGYIHNGADDNASGTAGLLELAQAFSTLPESPRRSILFAFWDSEESGLRGSRHWLAHPTLPGRKVAAMLCLDMIGRLRDERLLVFGSRTGFGWRKLVSQQNDASGLVLDFDWSLRADSDHYAFFENQVPVLHFHTGQHDEYHTPRDDAALVSGPGMERVTRLAFGVAWELANAPRAIGFRDESKRESPATLRGILQQQPMLPSRLGVTWSAQHFVGPGVRLTEVAPDSPAERAGLRPGDRLVKWGDRELRSGDDLLGAAQTADGPVSVVAMRPGQEKPLDLKVELAGEPLRIGILWRADEAEPGTAILTCVVPNSPAAQAGLEAGDRIYQVAGRDFASDEELAKLLTGQPGPIELTVERDGRLRTVTIRFAAQPMKRAA